MSPRRARQTPTPELAEPVAEVGSELPEVQEELDAPIGLLVSPTPRPLPRPVQGDELGDRFKQYEANMRAQAAVIYRELQAGPVTIRPDIAQVITWMRGKGVHIRAVMRVDGSMYVLDQPPSTLSES